MPASQQSPNNETEGATTSKKKNATFKRQYQVSSNWLYLNRRFLSNKPSLLNMQRQALKWGEWTFKTVFPLSDWTPCIKEPAACWVLRLMLCWCCHVKRMSLIKFWMCTQWTFIIIVRNFHSFHSGPLIYCLTLNRAVVQKWFLTYA